MKPWQQAALFAVAAPPVALAGVTSGLLPPSASIPLWYLLLAAPFWEEAFFRGVLQQRMLDHPWGSRRCAGLGLSNWLTGCFFVLVHLPFQGWRALAIILPALALGRLFEQTRQILPCVLMHSWFNLSWLMILQFR
ncbi:MAG: JDVT-CTERM system CAAX-type protease [Geobacter sp.]|nr:JDVT-CTERM system CAAX-type protease [Geobacter sp.]